MIAITISTIPRITAGMMSCLFLVMVVSGGDREADRERGADDGAVDRKRRQPVGLEERIRKRTEKYAVDAGAEGGDERRAADAVAVLAEQLGELERGGGADDRRRQQEAELGGVLGC